MSSAWGWRSRIDGDDHGGRTAVAEPRSVQIVLAVPSRARAAGAAVASVPSTHHGPVPVIALWHADVDPRDSQEADLDAVTTVDVDAGRMDDAGGHNAREESGPWATPGARRAVAVVQRAGVDAVATGNSVRVVLPADESQAVAAVERVTELPDRGPLVCVVAGPWGAAWLRTIEQAGTVHVAGPASSLDASRATFRRHGVDVVATPRPTGAVAAALLRAGWTARGLVRSAATTDGRDGGVRLGFDRPAGDRSAAGADDGQALLLLLMGLTLAIVVVGVLGAVAMAMSGREDHQRAIDVAALAAAAQLRAGTSDPLGGHAGRPTSDVRSRAAAAARTAARENGVATVEVDFPTDGLDQAGRSTTDGSSDARRRTARTAVVGDATPRRVRVRKAHRPTVAGVVLPGDVTATAEVAVPSYAESVATGDEYAGPLAIRQGKPMRPDVALAFDRMNAAATAAGHPLTVVSGYRSNAEQARLFAAHPDPKWVARPGTSLHRLGTELDLGPASAYGWLAASGRRFGFLRRYSWEFCSFSSG